MRVRAFTTAASFQGAADISQRLRNESRTSGGKNYSNFVNFESFRSTDVPTAVGLVTRSAKFDFIVGASGQCGQTRKGVKFVFIVFVKYHQTDTRLDDVFSRTARNHCSTFEDIGTGREIAFEAPELAPAAPLAFSEEESISAPVADSARGAGAMSSSYNLFM